MHKKPPPEREWDPVLKRLKPRTVRREKQWRWLVELNERFWDKVDRSDDIYACWPWRGAITPTGYGVFSVKGNGRHLGTTAQRFAWMLTHGSIPDGLTVDHLCGLRSCQNAAKHMQLLTLADNVRRSKWPRKSKRQG